MMSVLSELRMQPHVGGYTFWDASAGMRLALSGLVIFVLLCGANLATPLYPALQEQLSLGPMGTTVAFASYVLALLFCLVSIGHWSDHIGRRAALILAVLLGLAGSLVFASAQGLVGLCVGRALQGASVAMATGASAAALRELLPSKPQWASRFTLLASAGGVALGPLLGGLLALLPGGNATPFRVIGAVLLLLLVPLTLLRARPAIALAAPGERGRALAPRAGIIPATAGGEFWMAGLTGFLSFAIFGFVLSLAPGHLSAVFALHSLPLIGLLAGLALLSSSLVQLGNLHGRHVQSSATLALAVALLGLLIGLHYSFLSLVVLSMLLLGAGQGVAFQAAFGAAVDAVPVAEHARTVSAVYVITYLGSTLPVIGLGWAAGVFGLGVSIQVFLLGAILMALALAAVAWRSERLRIPRAGRTVES
ncbi:MFS transporter [Glutamicibacter sp. MNS18]|uniref:MFS transporter n=1 Tax=Glutamicibacter sp. MNS18 TaxID=2989817 RepID=UPI00278C575D|nr:MFS transporter [Glutamicibacter sp. MNS18]